MFEKYTILSMTFYFAIIESNIYIYIHILHYIINASILILFLFFLNFDTSINIYNNHIYMIDTKLH